MPLHLRPVGPLPASTYWARRAAVLAGLLVLLVLLAQCGGQDDAEQLAQAGPTPAATRSATPATSPAATPSAPVATPSSPAAVQPCPDEALRVSSTPGRASYTRGQRPVLRLGIRNAGTVPCTRGLGQGSVELLVFSGMDRIWSSDDCAPGGPEGVRTLQPQELEVITLTWAARRSRPGCAGPGEPIAPGTYRVVGRVGEVLTLGTTFLVR